MAPKHAERMPEAFTNNQTDTDMENDQADSRCRLCKNSPLEIVQHMVAGCEIQAGTTCIEGHNQIAGFLHREIFLGLA